MATNLQTKDYINGLFQRAYDLKDQIARHKESIIAMEEGLRVTKLAIAGFGGDPSIIDEIPDPKVLNSKNAFVEEQENGSLTWKTKVLLAIGKLETATPPQIVELIHRVEPDKTKEQIRKRVVTVLPKLEVDRKIKHQVISGSKRQRKKYVLA